MSKEVNDAFNISYKQTASVMGAKIAGQDIARVNKSTDEAMKKMNETAIIYKNLMTGCLKGFIAEEYHAQTFNVNAAVKGNDSRAFTPHATGGNNKNIDIRIKTKSGETIDYQSKYYKTAGKTSYELSNPEYKNMGKVAPAEQKADIKAHASRQAKRNGSVRPDQADNYEDTSKNIEDSISGDGIKSNPLSTDDAVSIAKDVKNGDEINAKKYGLTIEEFVKIKDVLRYSGKAALNAAVTASLLKAAPALVKIIDELFSSGDFHIEDFERLGLTSLNSAASGSLRGGIAAIITGSCGAGMVGDLAKSLSPEIIGASTAIAINAIQNSIKVAKGEMLSEEFANACIQDMFVAGLGLGSAALFQVLIPIPVLGSVIGNFIGSTVGAFMYIKINKVTMSFFIENGYSFLNIVTQDYKVPPEVLEKVGIRTINLDLVKLRSVGIKKINPPRINVRGVVPTTIDITCLKRGLIGVNRIGYNC